MRPAKSCVLLVLMISAILPATAQQRTYHAFNANIPFKFSIGDRKFPAGYYEFVIAGPGLMVMRDAHAHVLATLLTRELHDQAREAVPTRFVFEEKKKGHTRLVSIWSEKGAQGFQILKEEVAMRQTEPPPSPVLMYPPVIPGTSALYERPTPARKIDY